MIISLLTVILCHAKTWHNTDICPVEMEYDALPDKFEDITRVIQRRTSKNVQYNGQQKKDDNYL